MVFQLFDISQQHDENRTAPVASLLWICNHYCSKQEQSLPPLAGVFTNQRLEVGGENTDHRLNKKSIGLPQPKQWPSCQSIAIR